MHRNRSGERKNSIIFSYYPKLYSNTQTNTNRQIVSSDGSVKRPRQKEVHFVVAAPCIFGTRCDGTNAPFVALRSDLVSTWTNRMKAKGMTMEASFLLSFSPIRLLSYHVTLFNMYAISIIKLKICISVASIHPPA